MIECIKRDDFFFKGLFGRLAFDTAYNIAKEVEEGKRKSPFSMWLGVKYIFVRQENPPEYFPSYPVDRYMLVENVCKYILKDEIKKWT